MNALVRSWMFEHFGRRDMLKREDVGSAADTLVTRTTEECIRIFSENWARKGVIGDAIDECRALTNP